MQKAKEIYEKAKGMDFRFEGLADEDDLDVRLCEVKEIYENKAKKKLKKVSRNIRPQMSAMEIIRKEPVIKIYPDYNPRFSRNQMGQVSVKAWETARTMTTTPFMSEVKNKANQDRFEGYIKNSEVEYYKGIKPKTTGMRIRSRKVMKKSKTVAKIQFPKPQTSQIKQRQKLSSRGKSRNGNYMTDFHSLFSSNCQPKSIINPK